MDINCGPLSETTISGTPNLAKIDFNAVIIALDVVLASLVVYTYLEK